jgi:hypothetical protein
MYWPFQRICLRGTVPCSAVVKRQAEGKKTVPRISQNISKQVFVRRASFVRYMQYYSREKAVGKIKTRAKNPWHTELPVQDRVLHDKF